MSGTGTGACPDPDGTYLAVWPVDPDMALPAARRAATDDLPRLAELAGVTLTGPVRFTVCAAQSWHGPLGAPGDLLLVALAPARAVSAAWAGTSPVPPSGSAAAEHLLAAVRQLTADERSILALRYVAGFDAAEIGRALGLSASGVRSRLSRIVARLREVLQDE